MQQYIGKIVQLIYIDSQREVSIRNIKIIVVGKEKFLAYCYTAKGVRTFKHTGVVNVEEINPRLLGMLKQVNSYRRKQSV